MRSGSWLIPSSSATPNRSNSHRESERHMKRLTLPYRRALDPGVVMGWLEDRPEPQKARLCAHQAAGLERVTPVESVSTAEPWPSA
jgi:hypothetical protein